MLRLSKVFMFVEEKNSEYKEINIFGIAINISDILGSWIGLLVFCMIDNVPQLLTY